MEKILENKLKKMRKKGFLSSITLVLYCLCAMYLVVSFCNSSWNITEWDRKALIGFLFVVIVLVVETSKFLIEIVFED
jgi:amino acid transporter